jgi:AcrR family transcriptional regulator
VNVDDVDWLLAPLPSGRHGLTREQVAHSQRLRLVSSAIAVAGSEGYTAMTVSAVIARANVSRKTFYEQFADREHCFLAAYEVVVARALAGMRAAYATEAPWSERLRLAIGWALDALAAHPSEARVAFVEVLVAGPRALRLRDLALQELTPLFAPGFDVAPASTTIPSSMPLAIVGTFTELIGLQVRQGDVMQLPQLLPELLYCALAPFVGPAAAADAVAAERRAGAYRAPVRV